MYGLWSIVPPLVACILAIVTKRVIFSMFISVLVGGLIVSGGNPFVATAVCFDWIKDVMIDPWNSRFLVLMVLLGSGAAFMYKIGGSGVLARSLEKKLTSGKRAQMFAYLLGIIIFFNDYVNSIIVGNAAKEVNAKYKVSTEKLAYILDATAAPIATIGPVSDWIGFQLSLIAPILISIGVVGAKPYMTFLNSIPFNFYAILTLAAVPMIILGKDFGSMAKAELRAKKTGKLIADGSTPLSTVESDLGEPIKSKKSGLIDFILPLLTLILVGIWGIWYTGGGATGKNLIDCLADTDVAIALTWAGFAMTIVGIILGLTKGMSLRDCEDTLLNGFKTMMPAVVIIILTWSIGTVCSNIGTADYVITMTESWMSAGLLPLLTFVIAMILAFSTGTAWGTMAILIPIAIPLAYGVGGLNLIYVAIGAVFSGAIFGDHSSPISDTTVMASMFAGSDHVAHVITQVPYAMVTAIISGILFLASSVIQNGVILLIAGIVIQFFALRIIGNIYQNKYFTEEDRAILNEVKISTSTK